MKKARNSFSQLMEIAVCVKGNSEYPVKREVKGNDISEREDIIVKSFTGR